VKAPSCPLTTLATQTATQHRLSLTDLTTLWRKARLTMIGMEKRVAMMRRSIVQAMIQKTSKLAAREGVVAVLAEALTTCTRSSAKAQTKLHLPWR